MRHFELDVGEEFFEGMRAKRRRSPGEVVMVVLRPGGKVLLMTKAFYPADVYRLPSGRIRRGEPPDLAFVRELGEETGIYGVGDRQLDVIHFAFRCGGGHLDYMSYVFATEVISQAPEPEDVGEAITGFREVPVCDLREVAGSLAGLSGSWHDWGQFRAKPHEVACEHLCPQEVPGVGNSPESG